LYLKTILELATKPTTVVAVIVVVEVTKDAAMPSFPISTLSTVGAGQLPLVGMVISTTDPTAIVPAAEYVNTKSIAVLAFALSGSTISVPLPSAARLGPIVCVLDAKFASPVPKDLACAVNV
jgi:hypothetical protein